MRTWIQRSLWDVVPRDQRDSDSAFRRRQVVAAVVVLVGAAVLGWSLRLEPGGNTFYVSAIVLAGVWALGAFVSGRLHLGRRARGTEVFVRPIVAPIVLGLILGTIAERGFVQGHLIGGARGSVMAEFFGRPLSLAIIFFIALGLLWPWWAARSARLAEAKHGG